MYTGISIYPGLDGTAEDHITLLEKAAAMGIRRIFTSLHIPETNTTALREELQLLLQRARHYDIDVIADISPQTADYLGIDTLQPQLLPEWGITTARLDYGFDARKTALFSHIMPIQLNASTLQPAYVEALRKNGADFSHIDCLHNFYPRPHTGLSSDFVQKQTAWLQSEGLAVGAFISSFAGRRGPLYDGLPTIETHRTMDVSLASRHLAAMGMNSIFIGDGNPSEDELAALSATGQEDRDVVVIKARLISREPKIQDLLSYTFTSRLDAAAEVIRAQESRSHIGSMMIQPDGPQRALRRGDITIDNAAFQRYMGEIQLVLTDLPIESRTNIVAEIVPDELFLLSYITPAKKFRFKWVR